MERIELKHKTIFITGAAGFIGTEYTSSDGYHDGCDGYIDSDIYRFEPEFWSRWLGGIVVRRDGDAGVCDYGILSSL